MPEDLRRFIAHKNQDNDSQLYELQKNHQGGQRWTAEAWRAGIEANRARSESRFPVIIGPESFFKTAQELGEFLGMAAVASVTETKAASFEDLGNNEPLPVERSYLISDLNLGQLLDLEDHTNGEHITIWFQDERRDAWLPRCPKMEHGRGSDGLEQEPEIRATLADTPATIKNQEEEENSSGVTRH